MSDVVHLLNEYKAESARSTVDVELWAAKDDQEKLEKKLFEVEKQSSELVNANQGLLIQVE